MTTLRIALITVVLFLLAACGGTPVTREAPQRTNTMVQEQQPQEMSVQSLLTQAELQQESAKLESLLQALSLVETSECRKKLYLADLLEDQALNSAQEIKRKIIAAECHLQLGNIELAQSLINNIENQHLYPDLINLDYQIQVLQKNWFDAASSYYLLADDSAEDAQIIWQMLSQLGEEELIARQSSVSNLQPWLDLLLVQRKLPMSQSDLQLALSQWQTRYPEHPFNQAWPDTFAQSIQLTEIQRNRVAVLLPLSGRRQAQGEAVKSGILAAKFSSQQLESDIHFFDSTELSNIEADALDGFNVILGPLLKENIAQFQTRLPNQTPVLFLNQPDSPAALGELYFYALAPEEEAIQLVDSLSAQGIKKPVVVSSSGVAYQRMKNTFVQEWQLLTDYSPEWVSFTDNENLREGIAGLLDVDSSKGRIREIERTTNNKIHAFERSRRDIDAIIVFANASQTELINPIIESSISPFAKIVPVYATSRSYSTDLNKNSLRDLRNLTFMDMPWMLPSNNLGYFKRLTQDLWPNFSDSEQRLFAMGYDAFNLVPHLRHLKQVENKVYEGLTGSLTMNRQAQTLRELTWAQIQQEDVAVIEMD